MTATEARSTEMQIGAVAEAAGVSVQSVRFYEREGLIEEPPRRPSGYRVYPPGVIQKLRFIKRAKVLGFSLKEISELLALEHDAEATAEDIQRLADRKLNDLKDKVRSLQRMQRALQRLADDCPGTGPKSCCSILDSLANETRRNRSKS